MDHSSDGGTAGNSSASTRPYLIRALHDWCTDNGFTPYIAVHVDRSVQVPQEYVSNNEIVLNIGFDATSGLELGNEHIQFKARFGGTAREIIVPVDHVVAIYARENGQGMAFPAPAAATDAPAAAEPAKPATPLRGLRLAEAPTPAPEADAAEEAALALSSTEEGGDKQLPDPEGGPGAPGGGRPALKRIK
jgi:stringent starvation protein B